MLDPITRKDIWGQSKNSDEFLTLTPGVRRIFTLTPGFIDT